MLFERSATDADRHPSSLMALRSGSEDAQDHVRVLLCEEGRYRVADLPILGGARAAEQVVVRKGLDARCFPHCQAATLRGIMVNVVVTVFCDMARDGR